MQLTDALIGRIPDHGKDAVVILAGGAAEVGVELARPEFRGGERQAHIVLAGVFAAVGRASGTSSVSVTGNEVFSGARESHRQTGG